MVGCNGHKNILLLQCQIRFFCFRKKKKKKSGLHYSAWNPRLNSCQPILEHKMPIQRTPPSSLETCLFPGKWCRRNLLRTYNSYIIGVLRVGEVPLWYRGTPRAEQEKQHRLWGCDKNALLFLKLVWTNTYWLNRMLYWGHMPNCCRMESMWVWISRPPISTVPEVGGKRPVSIDLWK